MKHKILSLVLLGLVFSIGSVRADGTITAAATTDLGSGNTPRYVVEQSGVGRLMKNATGSSAWSLSNTKYLTTGSSIFALQTYNDITAIVIHGYGTGNGRTFSSIQVGTSTSNYADATATGTGTMTNTESDQTITITPSSTIAANSYVKITLSGNINIASVTLVYAAQTAPDAPSFSPNGGDVEGLSTVSIVSAGSTTYYQWSTNASAELTTSSEGWSTGTSAEVPNTGGTFYLYAYASNGATLNSSVVRSSAFNVTALDVTVATISWDFNNNTAPASAVLSAGSNLISGSSITMGSNLSFEANTDHCYVDSEGEDDVIVSRITPSSVASNNDLLFSIELKDGVTFLPTSISFVAMKQGTNNEVTVDAKWYEYGESDIALLTAQALKRASSSGTYAKPGGDRFEIDPSAKSVSASAGTIGLRLVLNTAKSYGIGEIKITGRFIGSPVVPTESYTVTFEAGTNGTCATESLTEVEPGAGVTLPDVTANSGYGFLGWFTAAVDGTKVGDAGETYYPTEDVEIYAQYQAEEAPTISIDDYNPQTLKTIAVTLTATATGSPDPTVTWYQSESAVASGGTSKGTGLTYKPNVTTVGTYYYYAVASNGVSPEATSAVVTLIVNDPDIYVSGDNYYVSAGDPAVNGSKIYADNITAELVAGGSLSSGAAEGSLNELNSNYIAFITSSESASNGWGPKFTATVDGTLSVGVKIGNNKTFSVTNVSDFYRQKVDEDTPTANGSSSYSVPSGSDYFGIITINVVAGTQYRFSVSGSKMGFYGFEFTPASVSGTISSTGYVTFSSLYPLDLSVMTGGSAYYASASAADAVTITSTTATVQAGEGLIIKGTSGDEFTIATAESGSAISGNLLVGCPSGATLTSNANYYVLVNNSGAEFQSLEDNGATIPAGKAYLAIPSGGSAPSALRIVEEENNATAIEDLKAAEETVKFIENGNLLIKKNGVVYDVTGRVIR